MNPLLGQTLSNRYRVDAPIGRGNMAEVYKVWDQRRGVYLAMKVLPKDGFDTVIMTAHKEHSFRIKKTCKDLVLFHQP